LKPWRAGVCAVDSPVEGRRIVIGLVNLGYPGFPHLVRRREGLGSAEPSGCVVALARQLAERSNSAAVEQLREREASLERSRIVREDVFSRSSFTETEERRLRATDRNPPRTGTCST
jgi:hypothetical protein